MQFKNKKIGKFRSLFERDINRQLRQRRKRNVKIEYESHSISYSIPRVYHPDFTIRLSDGRTIYLECKGYYRQEDKVKMKYVKLCNPTLDIRMIFPRRNKKDIAWCEKMGVPYAIGEVPEDWLV